jgi:hypothetical protein
VIVNNVLTSQAIAATIEEVWDDLEHTDNPTAAFEQDALNWYWRAVDTENAGTLPRHIKSLHILM